MDYSIIRAGGKQYMVKVGDEIEVERLKDIDQSSEVVFETLLRVQGEKVEIGEPALEDSTKAAFIEEKKGKKKVAMKYRPSGYRKKFGHRQYHTKVKIVSL